MDKLDELIKQLVAFRNEQDWEKFYTPRNLTTALPNDKQLVVPPLGSTPYMLRARLLSVIKQSQDFWEALFSLSIGTSTLKKFLDGHPLSEPTRKKLAKALSQTHPSVGILPTSEEQQSLSDAISTLIADERCVFELSSRAGVSRSTIRKVLAKQKITPMVEWKLRQALADLEASGPYSFSKESVVKKLIDVHNLYLEHKTLEAVGKRIGLTRERVRQLLRMGTSLGLFEYKPRGKEDLRKCITRDELLAAYKIHSNLKEVAAAYQISLHDLHSLLASYSITTKQLETLRRERQRQKCIEGYDCAIKELGHHPSTVEMYKRPEWRALVARISRLWGTIGAFRQDLGIIWTAKSLP